MQKVLLVGDENRTKIIASILPKELFDIEYSDGDEEEDFKEYDIIFDVNFDDDSENFPLYASLKDKIILLSTVKQSIAEINYIYSNKVRSKIYGLNCIEAFLMNEVWEVSAFRGNEIPDIEKFISKIGKKLLITEDKVGMVRPRIEFLKLNEVVRVYDEHIISTTSDASWLHTFWNEIDLYSVTTIFETLMAIYEDTKDIRYLPSTTLKKKYLRNHLFVQK